MTTHGVAGVPVILCELGLPDGSQGHYGKYDLELDGAAFYEGRVLQFGQLCREASDPQSGFVRSTVTVRLVDTDRHFSNKNVKGFLNRILVLKMALIPAPEREESARTFTSSGERILVDGEPVLLTPERTTTVPVATFKTLFTGVVATFQHDDGVFIMTAKSMDQRWMDRPFQARVTREAFPRAAQVALNTIIPIIYGEIRGEAP